MFAALAAYINVNAEATAAMVMTLWMFGVFIGFVPLGVLVFCWEFGLNLFGKI
jgi:hypothetical protein